MRIPEYPSDDTLVERTGWWFSYGPTLLFLLYVVTGIYILGRMLDALKRLAPGGSG